MVLGLFKKHCSICGKDIEKNDSITRFGKHHCSEEHAWEYRKKLAREESKTAGKGGCCG